MRGTSRLGGILAAIGVSCLAMSGCASHERAAPPGPAATEPERPAPAVPPTAATPAPAPAAPPQLVADTQAQPAVPAEADEKAKQEAEEKARKEAEEKAKKEAKEARDRQRKLVKLERDLEVARLKLSKLKIDHQNAEIKRDESVARATIDLELARQKLAEFKEISVPNRIERAKLSLRWAEDGLRDAREELEQLELMYSEEQFADKTKEIVIDRARRQLERTQRDHDLRQEEHKTLLEQTIPIETKEQELGVQDKERALAQMHRDEISAKLDRQIAVISAQAEIERLENELADLREEIKETEQKKAAEEPARETAAATKTP